ncbi:hypothetical protein OIE82_33240 [Streptomyces althioticus]|uniref:Uncharacterized protein n=1 Tax=Streptomyces althioticus TaxID=83380 RepID=A0ABZ1YEG3_9ACTN|nr:hypothetical protein OHA53_02235 [Streptomyces althioticus]
MTEAQAARRPLGDAPPPPRPGAPRAVRVGDVVAVHCAADAMAMANGRTSDAKVPPAVVKAQSEKPG